MTSRLASPPVLLILASSVALGACSDSPDALEPAPNATSPAWSVAAGQEAGIHALIAAQDAAWAAHDANAYAATYTENVEMINPIGGILAGREVLRAQHAFLFNPVSGFFRNSTSTWSLRSITFLTGSVALVKLDVTLTGFSGLPPGLPQAEPGVVRTRVTWIAVRVLDEWKIMHQQMTAVPPAP